MLSTLCDDIHRLFLTDKKQRGWELSRKADELSLYFMHHPATPESIKPIFDLERKLIAGKGSDKQYVEQRVFNALFDCAMYCTPEDAGEKRPVLHQSLLRGANKRKKEQHALALKLVNFALEVFRLRIARDTFNNKRKSLALELIQRVAQYYDIPEAMELYTAGLLSNKAALVFAAAEFYQVYMRDRGLSLPPEMVERLDAIIDKTKDRSVAVTLLNLQVESGEISELGALSRIDDWKERNLERYGI